MSLHLHSIPYGTQKLDFSLKRTTRRTLAIHVYPNKKIEVVAPHNTTLQAIYEKIKKRARWVKDKQIYFEQFESVPVKREFVSGETHYYLGRQYRLKIKQSQELSIKLVGKFFLIDSPKLNREFIQNALDDWYLSRAKKMFTAKVECFLNQYPKLLVAPKKTIVRKMAKRWGSCTQAGSIQFNLNLIKAPSHCIEYVVAHELCHLKIHDHSPAFYRLLSRIMPDWETRKSKLDTFVM